MDDFGAPMSLLPLLIPPYVYQNPYYSARTLGTLKETQNVYR